MDAAPGRDAVDAAFRGELTTLAVWCDEQRLAAQAELTRKWLPRREPFRDYVFVIPPSSVPPPALVESPAAQAWWEKFAALRKGFGEKYFALAEQAAESERPSEAIALVRQALREDPDHERARAILGYVRAGEGWALPRTARWLEAGKVWTDEFGWLPEDHVAKYRGGERYYLGRWIGADEEARQRGDSIKQPWQIETEHFAVSTTHSLQAGAKLAARLERLFDVWRAVFVEFYATPKDVRNWFANGAGPKNAATRRPHRVVYFRDKQQYVDHLQTAQPQIAMTLGMYFDRTKTAYFFAGDEQYDGTLNHEATHQLFRETRPGARELGKKNNFWIIEAIACYMESLVEHRLLPDSDFGMYFTVGGANEGRVPAARARLTEREHYFFLPLGQLVPLGMEALQREPSLPQIYSQSAGLAWFLMHGGEGRYRSPLMQYLIAVYAGRANNTTLEKLTGTTYEDLDREYAEFLK